MGSAKKLTKSHFGPGPSFQPPLPFQKLACGLRAKFLRMVVKAHSFIKFSPFSLPRFCSRTRGTPGWSDQPHLLHAGEERSAATLALCVGSPPDLQPGLSTQDTALRENQWVYDSLYMRCLIYWSLTVLGGIGATWATTATTPHPKHNLRFWPCARKLDAKVLDCWINITKMRKSVRPSMQFAHSCVCVWMCVYIYICACKYIYIYTYIYTYIYIFTYIYIYVYIYVYIYIYIFTYVYVYICICIYVYMYICIYVYMYICIYAYMYICIICIYIYVYMYIYIYVYT